MPGKISELGVGEILKNTARFSLEKEGRGKCGTDVFIKHLWPLGSFSLVKA